MGVSPVLAALQAGVAMHSVVLAGPKRCLEQGTALHLVDPYRFHGKVQISFGGSGLDCSFRLATGLVGQNQVRKARVLFVVEAATDVSVLLACSAWYQMPTERSREGWSHL